jgi:hypothetical protein
MEITTSITWIVMVLIATLWQTPEVQGFTKHESKEYQTKSTDIAVPNAGMEGKCGCQAIVIPIGSFEP